MSLILAWRSIYRYIPLFPYSDGMEDCDDKQPPMGPHRMPLRILGPSRTPKVSQRLDMSWNPSSSQTTTPAAICQRQRCQREMYRPPHTVLVRVEACDCVGCTGSSIPKEGSKMTGFFCNAKPDEGKERPQGTAPG